MFDRTKKLTVNVTNSYLVEMVRAILEQLLDCTIYLTQTQIVTNPEQKASREVAVYRRFANAEKTAVVEVLFTSVDYPRRHGVEGVAGPRMPSARVDFFLTSETNGFYNWQILTARVSYENFYGNRLYEPHSYGSHQFVFHPESLTEGFVPAPNELQQLAGELERRRPSMMSGDD